MRRAGGGDFGLLSGKLVLSRLDSLIQGLEFLLLAINRLVVFLLCLNLRSSETGVGIGKSGLLGLEFRRDGLKIGAERSVLLLNFFEIEVMLEQLLQGFDGMFDRLVHLITPLFMFQLKGQTLHASYRVSHP